MVSVKIKKQLNLPQLIEWAMKNDMHERSFCGDRYGDAVHFDENEDMLCDHVSLTETFTVEVEEEITEDTEIPKLMTTFEKTCLEGGIGYQRVRIDENYPIKLMLNEAEAHGEPVETLHVVNDDDTHTLIWRDGRLIE